MDDDNLLCNKCNVCSIMAMLNVDSIMHRVFCGVSCPNTFISWKKDKHLISLLGF